jgi:hypothetical protein
VRYGDIQGGIYRETLSKPILARGLALSLVQGLHLEFRRLLGLGKDQAQSGPVALVLLIRVAARNADRVSVGSKSNTFRGMADSAEPGPVDLVLRTDGVARKQMVLVPQSPGGNSTVFLGRMRSLLLYC